MVNILRLAVLITCHNRREKTLSCLSSLSQQNLSTNVVLQVYLVDDGSTDGTREAISDSYPTVKLIPGDGNLFWNGGMRLAFGEAMKADYDYYLWLNDDTLLYPNALNNLLTTYTSLLEQDYHRPIVVGSTQAPETGVFTYGGMIRTNKWHPFKFDPVEPGEEAKPCLTMNGNCVLIPRKVVKRVGNLDTAFTHGTGDVDYGLRACQQGCSVWVAPGYIGTCEENLSGLQVWEQPNKTLRQRWYEINQPKCLPIQEWKIFAYRHGGWLWRIYWLLPYARLFLKAVFKNFKSHQISAKTVS
ncbi:MAG: glycosyltransferase family 2 protein [Calothrix sp. MO_192.B10]|nr:glycosyltransferase family 2 protein [Calothrix sp. MO_192.B10]